MTPKEKVPAAVATQADTKRIKLNAAKSIESSPAAQEKSRLRHLAGRLYALGPKPLFHFLDEVERGAPLLACPASAPVRQI
jgi:hypothetical protein